jgi:hypothetical protein
MRIKRFKNFLFEGNSEKNNYTDYLDQIIGITHGKQKEWFEWQKNNGEEVIMEDPEEVFPLITREWSKKNLKVKDCYKNATTITGLDPDMRYVEGVMVLYGQIPIDHAWNSYKGRYFDATSHLWNPSDEKNLHYKLIELDYSSLWEVLRETKVYGEIPSYLFRKGRLR